MLVCVGHSGHRARQAAAKAEALRRRQLAELSAEATALEERQNEVTPDGRASGT